MSRSSENVKRVRDEMIEALERSIDSEYEGRLLRKWISLLSDEDFQHDPQCVALSGRWHQCGDRGCLLRVDGEIVTTNEAKPEPHWSVPQHHSRCASYRVDGDHACDCPGPEPETRTQKARCMTALVDTFRQHAWRHPELRGAIDDYDTSVQRPTPCNPTDEYEKRAAMWLDKMTGAKRHDGVNYESLGALLAEVASEAHLNYPRRVWVVEAVDAHSSEVQGVFTSRELADQYLGTHELPDGAAFFATRAYDLDSDSAKDGSH